MSFLFAVLVLICGAVAALVTLSYAFAWYEGANRDPQLLQGRFAPKRLGLAARLITMEILLLLLSLLAHPFGWFRPAEKNGPGNFQGAPVLLLHGLFHSRACWLWMKFRLRRRGFRSVHTLNLPPWKDVETLTERVARKVDELRHAAGAERVCLVGHSMGGIIARNYLQLRGGAQKVERCIVLAAPNGGSKLVPFALSSLGNLVMPGSPFLHRLAEAPIPSGVEPSAIYTRHDNIVLPVENARWEGVRNVELAGMGHTALLYHPRAFEALVEELQREKP